MNFEFSRNHSRTPPPAGESQTEEGEPSVNQLPPQEAGPSVPYQDQGLPTDRNGNPMDLNARPSLSSLYNEIESSDSLRARNLQLGEDLERIHEMERNLQNERDPDRRREVAARIDREVRELERQISLCQTRDAVRDDQLDVWREGLYEELATQGEKQARLTLLNSWLKVIIHTRNHQPPKNESFRSLLFFLLDWQVYNNLNRASLGWAYLHP